MNVAISYLQDSFPIWTFTSFVQHRYKNSPFIINMVTTMWKLMYFSRFIEFYYLIGIWFRLFKYIFIIIKNWKNPNRNKFKIRSHLFEILKSIWFGVHSKQKACVWLDFNVISLVCDYSTSASAMLAKAHDFRCTPYASKQIYRLCERITSGGFSHNTQILITWNFDCTQALWTIFKNEQIC